MTWLLGREGSWPGSRPVRTGMVVYIQRELAAATALRNRLVRARAGRLKLASQDGYRWTGPHPRRLRVALSSGKPRSGMGCSLQQGPLWCFGDGAGDWSQAPSLGGGPQSLTSHAGSASRLLKMGWLQATSVPWARLSPDFSTEEDFEVKKESPEVALLCGGCKHQASACGS